MTNNLETHKKDDVHIMDTLERKTLFTLKHCHCEATKQTRQCVSIPVSSHKPQTTRYNMLFNLNEKNFNIFIEEPTTVIMFSSESCIPCKATKETLKRIAESYTTNARWGTVDIEESRSLMSKYSITSLPTTIYFRRGTPITSIIGSASESKILAKLEDVQNDFDLIPNPKPLIPKLRSNL